MLAAFSSAFLSSKLSVRSSGSSLFAACADKEIDANGRCPGDAGYRPVLREAPTDFAAFAAAQKAAKADAGPAKNCMEKEIDANGRCPGEAGYRPVLREAPTDFAAFQAAQKKK